MNNDLWQFSEERLKKMIFLEGLGCAVYKTNEVAALARIALAAKQAKPVAWEVKGILCHTKEEADVFIGEPEPLYDTPQPAHTEQVIPDGWKLVPIEPTYEMKLQVHPIAVGTCHNCGCEVNPDCEDNVLLSWQDMLAAAPKPESE